MTYRKEARAMSNKQVDRDLIEEQTKAFIASGGAVTEIKRCDDAERSVKMVRRVNATDGAL